MAIAISQKSNRYTTTILAVFVSFLVKETTSMNTSSLSPSTDAVQIRGWLTSMSRVSVSSFGEVKATPMDTGIFISVSSNSVNDDVAKSSISFSSQAQFSAKVTLTNSHLPSVIKPTEATTLKSYKTKVPTLVYSRVENTSVESSPLSTATPQSSGYKNGVTSEPSHLCAKATSVTQPIGSVGIEPNQVTRSSSTNNGVMSSASVGVYSSREKTDVTAYVTTYTPALHSSLLMKVNPSSVTSVTQSTEGNNKSHATSSSFWPSVVSMRRSSEANPVTKSTRIDLVSHVTGPSSVASGLTMTTKAFNFTTVTKSTRVSHASSTSFVGTSLTMTQNFEATSVKQSARADLGSNIMSSSTMVMASKESEATFVTQSAVVDLVSSHTTSSSTAAMESPTSKESTTSSSSLALGLPTTTKASESFTATLSREGDEIFARKTVLVTLGTSTFVTDSRESSVAQPGEHSEASHTTSSSTMTTAPGTSQGSVTDGDSYKVSHAITMDAKISSTTIKAAYITSATSSVQASHAKSITQSIISVAASAELQGSPVTSVTHSGDLKYTTSPPKSSIVTPDLSNSPSKAVMSSSRESIAYVTQSTLKQKADGVTSVPQSTNITQVIAVQPSRTVRYNTSVDPEVVEAFRSRYIYKNDKKMACSDFKSYQKDTC
ncbi:uncharacterized protein DDB_G0271670 [Nematostella vectensis]|uniref:uncharacterized protein DDB_G0271670 n=1 Tax=Nematostella vectensis TaxID=45351 RepID=UPI0020775038|nr:uncharacterized protein DDB_G0271670 [Nematostella vectensis]